MILTPPSVHVSEKKGQKEENVLLAWSAVSSRNNVILHHHSLSDVLVIITAVRMPSHVPSRWTRENKLIRAQASELCWDVLVGTRGLSLVRTRSRTLRQILRHTKIVLLICTFEIQTWTLFFVSQKNLHNRS